MTSELFKYDFMVGIPTYNRAALLERALQSVLAQNEINVAIVVSDNNSTDSTYEVMQKYLEYANIFYIRNKFNIGPVANYNQCLAHSRGRYFMMLSDDDVLSPNYCEIAVRNLSTQGGIFLGKCAVVNERGEILRETEDGRYKIDGLSALRRQLSHSGKRFTYTNFMLATETSKLWKAGGFPQTEMAQHSDNLLMDKLLLENDLVYDSAATFFYSVYPESYGNQNVVAVALASSQYVAFWDREVRPCLAELVGENEFRRLRRRLIEQLGMLYCDRIIKYGQGIGPRIKLLIDFPRWSWLFSAVFSKSFVTALLRRFKRLK